MHRFLAALAIAAGCAAAAGADLLTRGPLAVEFEPGDRAVAEQSLAVLSEALAEFAPVLPPGDAPIRVIVAPTEAVFDRYAQGFAGLEVSGVAHSEAGVIAVKAPWLRTPGDDYRGTLRHELVHVLLARHADTGRLPRWLNEGLAMSLANEFRWGSMFQVARMFVENRIIEYRHLDLALRAPGGPRKFSDAYAQSLSMTRYLRDRIGDERLWAAVRATRDLGFPDALERFGGITTRQLWAGYQRSLWRVLVVASLTSGSFMIVPALLVIAAWVRQQLRNRRILRRWSREEAAAALEPPVALSWDDFAEDPDAWKNGRGNDDESEDWRAR